MTAIDRVDAHEPARVSALSPPRWRGVLHTWCFLASLPAGALLVATAPNSSSAFAGFIFAFGVSVMFGASALFHRTLFDDHTWYRFRRVDHMGIYLCIAGGFTPFGMLALDGWQSEMFLVGGWVGAGLGIALRFAPFRPPPGLMHALFLTLSWFSILVLPTLWDTLGPGWMALTLVGGGFYTVGAIIVGVRRPDPWPTVFGYHEIWHLFVAIAVTCHYVVVAFALMR